MALQDIVTKGSTDCEVDIYAFDNTTGLPKVDLAFNSSGIALWYRRQGAAVVDITEATLASLTTAHTDGGFIAKRDGHYRLDLPDAAVASGADFVDYGGTATGFTLVGGRLKLSNINFNDSVRAGLTALPNAAADAAGGLPISDAGGLNMDGLATAAALDTVDNFLDTEMAAVLAAVDTEIGALATALATVDGIVDTLALGIITGTAATGTLSTTQCTSSLTGYANDDLIGRRIVFTGGTADGCSSFVTDYVASGGLLTFSPAIATAPANSDPFKLV